MKIISIFECSKDKDKSLIQKLLHEHLEEIMGTNCFDFGRITSSVIPEDETLCLILSTTEEKWKIYEDEHRPRMKNHYEEVILNPGYARTIHRYVFI